MYVSRSQTDWDDTLACAEVAVNNAHQVSIGLTPFFPNYGFHPYLLVSLLPSHRVLWATAFAQRVQRLIAKARNEHRIATQRYSQYANSKRIDVLFALGDWLRLSSKNVRFNKNLRFSLSFTPPGGLPALSPSPSSTIPWGHHDPHGP
jgi:hypothetical protein